MFRARMMCRDCGAVSEDFIVGYLPWRDAIDLVFQNRQTHQFRIVVLDNLHGRAELPREAAITEAVETRLQEIEVAFATGATGADEWRVETDIDPREQEPMTCPQCSKQTVRMKLCSII